MERNGEYFIHVLHHRYLHIYSDCEDRLEGYIEMQRITNIIRRGPNVFIDPSSSSPTFSSLCFYLSTEEKAIEFMKKISRHLRHYKHHKHQ